MNVMGCEGREIEEFLGNLSEHNLKTIGRSKKFCHNSNTLTFAWFVI